MNEKPSHGHFALLLAARNGHKEVVCVLLEAGADAKQVSPVECRCAEFGAFRKVITLDMS